MVRISPRRSRFWTRPRCLRRVGWQVGAVPLDARGRSGPGLDAPGAPRRHDLAQHRARPRRTVTAVLGRRGPAATRPTSARSAAGCGRPPTAARPGRRSPTVRSRSSSVGAVAVSETNPDLVFIGTGESCIRGNIQPGDGVYRSTDAGRTWTARRIPRGHEHLEDPHPSRPIRTSSSWPPSASTASPNDERGVFKSTRRRQHVAQGALSRRQDRRGRHLRSIAATRTSCTPRCGRPSASSTRCRAAGPAAACSSPPTAARPGRRSRATRACRPGVVGRIGVSVSGADSQPCLRARRERERRPVRLRRRAARPGRWSTTSRNIRQRAFYYTHVTADPQRPRPRVPAERRHLQVHRRRHDDGELRRRRLATTCGSTRTTREHVLHASDGGGAVTFDAGAPPAGPRATIRRRSTTTS